MFMKFSENNGSLDLKFIVQPNNPGSDDTRYFGSALALEDGLLVVGAHDAYVGSHRTGVAYLFDVNGTSPVQLARLLCI